MEKDWDGRICSVYSLWELWISSEDKYLDGIQCAYEIKNGRENIGWIFDRDHAHFVARLPWYMILCKLLLSGSRIEKKTLYDEEGVDGWRLSGGKMTHELIWIGDFDPYGFPEPPSEGLIDLARELKLKFNSLKSQK
jgi:hypothetical protein